MNKRNKVAADKFGVKRRTQECVPPPTSSGASLTADAKGEHTDKPVELPATEQKNDKKHDWLKIVPVIISALALVISTGGLLYTIRTYTVSNRPYLGVTDSNFQLVEDPPRAIVWKFTVKNVGSQPAVLKIEEHKTTLTAPSGDQLPLPLVGSTGETVSYVMPNQAVELTGFYSEVNSPVRMEEILNGSAFLDTYIKLSYSSEGALGRNQYSYSTQIRFYTVKGVAPGFSTVKAEGN